MSEVLTETISPKKLLRKASIVCAYCGIPLDESNKTADHVIPKVSGRINKISNIVFCCAKCNVLKGKMDVNSFLTTFDRQEYFENYLKTVDFKINNVFYSELVRKRIEKSNYICTKTVNTEKAKRKNEDRSCYYILSNSASIAITETQAKILDYFLEHKHLQDRSELSTLLGISNTELNYHITCINNLTGILPLSKVSENGITFNSFFDGIEKISEIEEVTV